MSTAAMSTDDSRRTADLLLDRDRLRELIGRPVSATRLRHKPGLSTVAALTEPGEPPGWVQVVTPGHLDKVDKAAVRSAAHGGDVRVRPAGHGLTVAWGGLSTDRRLRPALRALRLRAVDHQLHDGRLGLLRYNPQRRLVLRQPNPDGDLVLRATAADQRTPATTAAFAEAGLPVVTALPPVENTAGNPARVSRWPWFGEGTAAGHGADVAEQVGARLGQLHRADVRLPADAPRHDPLNLVRRALAVVTDLAQLDPALARRAGGPAERIVSGLTTRSWTLVPVHGDFSTDQVLVGRDGDLRFIDFDRAGLGPAGLDLGVFAAVELLTGDPAQARAAALLRGYRETAPVPDETELRLWTARALLDRVAEPFRAGQPDWAAQISVRLDQLNEVLS